MAVWTASIRLSRLRQHTLTPIHPLSPRWTHYNRASLRLIITLRSLAVRNQELLTGLKNVFGNELFEVAQSPTCAALTEKMVVREPR